MDKIDLLSLVRESRPGNNNEAVANILQITL